MLYPNQKSHILWCYAQIKNPKHPYEEERDNWPEVDRRKRSAFEADRWRGSELDDGGDVDTGRAGNV